MAFKDKPSSHFLGDILCRLIIGETFSHHPDRELKAFKQWKVNLIVKYFIKRSPVNRVRYISLDIQIIYLNFFCNNLRGDFKIFPGFNYISGVFQGFFQKQS